MMNRNSYVNSSPHVRVCPKHNIVIKVWERCPLCDEEKRVLEPEPDIHREKRVEREHRMETKLLAAGFTLSQAEAIIDVLSEKEK